MNNINTDELKPSVLSLISKLYPSGTVLIVNNGKVEVRLPQQKAKKVIPPVSKKNQIQVPYKEVYLTDAQVHWNGDECFLVSSRENNWDQKSLHVNEKDINYFVETLRGEGTTEDLEFNVIVHYDDNDINYLEFKDYE